MFDRLGVVWGSVKPELKRGDIKKISFHLEDIFQVNKVKL